MAHTDEPRGVMDMCVSYIYIGKQYVVYANRHSDDSDSDSDSDSDDVDGEDDDDDDARGRLCRLCRRRRRRRERWANVPLCTRCVSSSMGWIARE